MSNLEVQFHHAMIGIYEKAKEFQYYATYFKRMVDQYGGLNAAKRLLATRDVQDGFMRLWEWDQLDISMEAWVIQERFRPLFAEDEIAKALRRLNELGYFE